MKLTPFLPAALALTLSVQAQTNSTIPLTPSANPAPTSPGDGPRRLSLEQCINLALEKNLNLRIERYNPQLSVFDLGIARAGYDPVFSSGASREHDHVTGEFDSNNRLIPPGDTDNDILSSSLKGSLPWGMSYNLQGIARQSQGDSWKYNTNTASFLNTSADTSGGEASITLTQPLLRDAWIDQNRLNISVAKNRLKYSEQGLREQIMTTVSAVEISYYEVIFSQENIRVQEKSLQLAEQLFQENKKRVEVGVLAPLEEKQAQSQMAARRADLLSAQQEYETRQNVLKTLITDDYAAWHDVIIQPAEALTAREQFFNVRDSWSRGLNERPDLVQARLDLERAGIQLKYDRNQVFPQLDLFGTYGRFGNGAEMSDSFSEIRRDNQPYYVYGVEFSIPLGNLAARNRYKSSKVTVEQKLLSLKKSEQSAMVRIDEAIKLAQSSFARVDATRQASEFAEAALLAEQKKLENGKSTSFEVLRLQNDLTSARFSEIRALADYNKSLTAVAQAEASTLERRKIDVRVK